VLSQELGGDYEVIISDDCSTDDTQRILRTYASRHPERVQMILGERNTGRPNEVAARALDLARGEYIALFDGDDYWTSPAKLATQVRCLDDRPELSMSFHNALVVYEDDDRQPHPFHMERPTGRMTAPIPRPVSRLEDLLGGNFIQTASVLYRRAMLPELPDWYAGLALGDWPLWVLLAERGPIAYIDEILSAYRVHHGGMWSESASRFQRVEDVERVVQVYRVLNEHLGDRYTDRINAALQSFCRYAGETIQAEGRIRDANEVRRLANLPEVSKLRAGWTRYRQLPRSVVRRLRR
jgi:glycosyltransferase involved in cell wall biosynthesis